MSEKKNSWTRRTLATINEKNPISKFGRKVRSSMRSAVSAREDEDPITKFGEKIGAPIRSAVSTKADKNPITKFGKKVGTPIKSMVMKIMRRKGLSETTMGSKDYNTAFSKLKNLMEKYDNSGFNEYVKSQKEKINKQ